MRAHTQWNLETRKENRDAVLIIEINYESLSYIIINKDDTFCNNILCMMIIFLANLNWIRILKMPRYVSSGALWVCVCTPVDRDFGSWAELSVAVPVLDVSSETVAALLTVDSPPPPPPLLNTTWVDHFAKLRCFGEKLKL